METNLKDFQAKTRILTLGGARYYGKEEDRNSITNNLKIDQDVTMGIVTDIKQELRKANSLRVNYGSRKKATR